LLTGGKTFIVCVINAGERFMSLRRSNGFTLIELMVTMAVLAVLVAVGFPNFLSVIRSNRVVAANNETLCLLSLARSEAIRNNSGGGVCGSATGSSCDGDWNSGILAFADPDGSGTFETGETVLRYSQGHPKLIVDGPENTAISFDGRGRRQAGADQTLTLRPDECGSQPMQRTVTINSSGQARSAQGACQ